MAKKKTTSTTSINGIEMFQDKATITIGSEENHVDVTVKTRIPLSDRANMINGILGIVFTSDENDNLSYNPEFKDFAFSFQIINYFTDISLPADINKANEFLEGSNIVSDVIDAVGEKYIAKIISEANEAIEYKKQELLKRTKFDQIADSISDIIGEVRDKVENINIDQVLSFAKDNIPDFNDKFAGALRESIEE